MKVTIEGGDLVVRIPMQEPTPSASGATVKGKPVTVGLNAYIRGV